jgi:hypothetical protein
MAHIFVTGNVTVENVIIDGADMTAAAPCKNQRSDCFTNTGSGWTPSTPGTPAYNTWDTTSNYQSTFKSPRYYGVFVFQYIKDYTGAPIPSLTLNNVQLRNFIYSKYHTTFIQFDKLASKLTITNSKFEKFYFPHGLISSSISTTDRNYLYVTSSTGETCKTADSTVPASTDCHSIDISGSTFSDINPLKTAITNTNQARMEGGVLAVHNLDGPISIKASSFR